MELSLVFTLTETNLIFFFWSVNYANLVFKLLWFGYGTQTVFIVFIGNWLVLTYIERLFSTICCCFCSYICWSVNCMSGVSKFHNFYLTCSEIEGRFILGGFKYFPFWFSFSFFHLVCKFRYEVHSLCWNLVSKLIHVCRIW